MNEQINKKQNNNILQIIIIILLVVLIAIGGMILLKDNKKDNSGTNNNISENENNNNISKDYVILKFDGTKAINPTNSESKYSLWDNNDYSLYGGVLGINQMYLKKRSIVLNIDFNDDNLSNAYGINRLDKFEAYDINNFDKDIKNVYLTGFGQGYGYETIFYVMEDGTVEYTPIRYILKHNNINDTTIFKSFGKIDGVTGVVKLLNGFEDYPGLAGGGSTIIGIKEDGTFYDLGKILCKTQYYQY